VLCREVTRIHIFPAHHGYWIEFLKVGTNKLVYWGGEPNTTHMWYNYCGGTLVPRTPRREYTQYFRTINLHLACRVGCGIHTRIYTLWAEELMHVTKSIIAMKKTGLVETIVCDSCTRSRYRRHGGYTCRLSLWLLKVTERRITWPTTIQTAGAIRDIIM
jgi:hypothetical protein